MRALHRGFAALLLLAFAGAQAATISGHVIRSSNSQPIDSANVVAFRASDLGLETQQLTLADGSYALTLGAGSYLIVASATGFVGELFDDIPCPPCDGNPVVVSVTANELRGNVDFALDKANLISGHVRHAGSLAPVPNASVAVEQLDGTQVSSVSTDASGDYAASASNGSYRVRVGGADGALGQYFSGVPCNVLVCDPATATTVSVSGSDVGGIDFTLASGGSIGGTLRRKSDNALLDVATLIEIYKADGDPVLSFQTFTPDYRTSEPLPAADYRVIARPEATYLPKIWNDHACGGADSATCQPTSGDLIAVGAGVDVSNIDFALLRGTSTVAGHVTAFAGGAPLEGVTVEARREVDAATVQATTGADGSYLIEVPAGNYTVRAFGTPPLADEAYPGVQCSNQTCGGAPQVLPLPGGTDQGGVDFALAPAGSITIGVRDGASNTLIGAELRVLLPGFAGPQQFFAASGGTAIVPVLSGGAVRFAARNNGDGCGPLPLAECLGELYPDTPCANLQCDIATGAAIDVGKGEDVAGIEVVLGKGANVAGQVLTSGTLAPINAAAIEIVDSNNVVSGGATTDGDGNYLATGLATGTYFARTATAGFLDELYDDLPCPGGACSPVSGAPLATTAGQTLGGIDFVLAPGATIGGKVRSLLTVQPIANATVTVFDANGQQAALAATKGDGTYATRALAAGTYRVRFDASGFSSSLFDGVSCTPQSCNPASGTAVVLTPPGNATGIDADLAGGSGASVSAKLVYLDACKPSGCVVHQGFDSAINNTSSIVGGTSILPPFPFSDALFNQVVQCVRNTFAPFAVNFTTADPGNVPHREFMFSTTPDVAGFDSGTGGVSPWACGVPLENTIAFGFASFYGENVADLCNVAAHEIGHQLGLDHEFYCPDHMTYLEGCGQKSFADFDSQCGTFSPEFCYCGSAPSQNTFEKLSAVAGPSTRVFADSFEAPLVDFLFGRPLGPQTTMPVSCGTETRRPNVPMPQWFQ